LEVIESFVEFYPKKSTILTFGTYDGIHLGHQVVIKKVVDKAQKIGLLGAVLSFDPHPMYYLSPQNCPPTLTTTSKKLELLESMGIDLAILARLEDYISHMSPEKFVKKILVENLLAKYIIVGYDCSFGKSRAGNAKLLQELGKNYNIPVEIVQAQKYKDIIISSTRIRKAIAVGNLQLAKCLLGRDYSFSGKVVKGYGLGKKIGYPTANIDTNDQMLPPNGVYAVKAKVDEDYLKGVLNIGFRPTFEGIKLQVEVHLFNFERSIYGKNLEVYLFKKIRNEQKFPNLDDLVKQIKEDIRKAKQMLN